VRFAGFLILAACLGCATAPDLRTGPSPRTFRFPFVHDYGVQNEIAFVWDDAWLLDDARQYHQRLAGPLAALAASTYGYRLDMDVRTFAELDFQKDQLVRRYGRDLDYADPAYGKDQTGYTIGHRRAVLDGRVADILLVAVRGTFGRVEWVSNFNVCNTWGHAAHADPSQIPVHHEGFARATGALYARLLAFARERGVDFARAKVIVTGHSRGGSVANLLGARLDNEAGDASSPFGALLRRNLFVYTFATPNVVLSRGIDAQAARYDNIFNVVNPEDMVSRVPIARWNAARYGRDLYLKCFDDLYVTGSFTDAAYNDMKSAFRDMTGYAWWHTPFGLKSTELVPQLLGAVAPTIVDLYAVPDPQRADGNLTSIHSIFETVIWRTMKDALESEREISLGADVNRLTRTYSKVADREASPVALPEEVEIVPFLGSGLFVPDGRDFSRQPGFFDFAWRLSCMHATQTYIGWMKAGEMHGPESIYTNWKEPNP